VQPLLLYDTTALPNLHRFTATRESVSAAHERSRKLERFSLSYMPMVVNAAIIAKPQLFSFPPRTAGLLGGRQGYHHGGSLGD